MREDLRDFGSFPAVVLRKPGTDLEIVNLVVPRLLEGQVLVQMKFSGVCRSQLMEARGLRGDDVWVPHLLGHEGVGTVLAIGSGVSKVAPGDSVILGWIKGNGLDSPAPVFRSVDGERINAGRVTTFSEFTVVSENRVFLKPIEIPDQVAVLFGCALLTGAGMVTNEARPAAGEVVLINGLGGVGLAALIASGSLDIQVVAADPDAEKRRLAAQLGANFVVDPTVAGLVEQVTALFPTGVDVALDAAGTASGIEAAFECLTPEGGRLIFASHPPADERICLDPHALIRGRSISGSWGGSSRPDVDIPNLARSIRNAGIDLSFMTPRTYALQQVNEALNDLEHGRGIRPLIAMNLDG